MGARDERAARLASLGEVAFDWYVREVLPKELEEDATYRAQFDEDDGSRINLAFLRWQKRVYSLRDRVPVEEIIWDGKPVPMYPGLPYAWPALYDSPAFGTLLRKMTAVCSTYLNRMEGNRDRRSFRIFAWAEVYRQNDFQRPHVHTGALASGTFAAQYSGEQKLVFEDPRGGSAPFGRKHYAQLAEGEMVIWPAWASHHLTPNTGSTANVFYSFVVWPPNGATDFDWEDDATGDYVYRKTTHVRRQQPPPAVEQAPPGASKASDEL